MVARARSKRGKADQRKTVRQRQFEQIVRRHPNGLRIDQLLVQMKAMGFWPIEFLESLQDKGLKADLNRMARQIVDEDGNRALHSVATKLPNGEVIWQLKPTSRLTLEEFRDLIRQHRQNGKREYALADRLTREMKKAFGEHVSV